MKLTKPLVLALAATAVGTSLLGAGIVSAAQGTDHADPMSSLVDAIAAKFNLDRSAVQQVVDDQHAAMEQEREQSQADRLSAAVADGTLTQAQADAITAKQAELKAAMESSKDMTETERRDAMKAQFDDLKAWASENGIPDRFVPFGPGRGHGPGERGGMMPPAPKPAA